MTDLILLLNNLTPFDTWIDIIVLIFLSVASIALVQILLDIFLTVMTIAGAFLTGVVLLLLGKKID
jgi:hypothetical protein